MNETRLSQPPAQADHASHLVGRLLLICILLVGLALAYFEPLLGVPLAFFSIVAWLRTFTIERRYREVGHPMSASGRSGSFLVSFVEIVCLTTLAIILFYFTMFSLVTLLDQSFGETGGVLAVILSLVMFVSFICWVLNHRRRPH